MSNFAHETIIENPDEEDKTSSNNQETIENNKKLNKINRILDKYRDSPNDYNHLFNKKSRIKGNDVKTLEYNYKPEIEDLEVRTNNLEFTKY